MWDLPRSRPFLQISIGIELCSRPPGRRDPNWMKSNLFTLIATLVMKNSSLACMETHALMENVNVSMVPVDLDAALFQVKMATATQHSIDTNSPWIGAIVVRRLVEARMNSFVDMRAVWRSDSHFASTRPSLVRRISLVGRPWLPKISSLDQLAQHRRMGLLLRSHPMDEWPLLANQVRFFPSWKEEHAKTHIPLSILAFLTLTSYRIL